MATHTRHAAGDTVGTVVSTLSPKRPGLARFPRLANHLAGASRGRARGRWPPGVAACAGVRGSFREGLQILEG